MADNGSLEPYPVNESAIEQSAWNTHWRGQHPWAITPKDRLTQLPKYRRDQLRAPHRNRERRRADIRLSPEFNERICDLEDFLDVNMSEVLRRAVDRYWQELIGGHTG